MFDNGSMKKVINRILLKRQAILIKTKFIDGIIQVT